MCVCVCVMMLMFLMSIGCRDDVIPFDPVRMSERLWEVSNLRMP